GELTRLPVRFRVAEYRPNVATESPWETNSVICNSGSACSCAIPAKKAMVSVLPLRTPVNTISAGPSAIHSTLSATWDRTPAISPRPNAAYISFTISTGLDILVTPHSDSTGTDRQLDWYVGDDILVSFMQKLGLLFFCTCLVAFQPGARIEQVAGAPL